MITNGCQYSNGSNGDSDSKSEGQTNDNGNNAVGGSLWLQGLRCGDERLNGRLGILHLTTSQGLLPQIRTIGRQTNRHQDVSK